MLPSLARGSPTRLDSTRPELGSSVALPGKMLGKVIFRVILSVLPVNITIHQRRGGWVEEGVGGGFGGRWFVFTLKGDMK